MSIVSPVLVGRVAEQRALRAAAARARGGTGTAVFLVGEPGIGKSRLAASLGAEVTVIRGRAGTIPLRAITEAVLTAMRPDDEQPLGGFWPVLWRLVSDSPEKVADPSLVRAEAVLRLLARRPGVLVLEDLHDADADTLEIVEYLVDNLATRPVALVATLRPDGGPALDLVTRAAARRVATVHRLARLDRAETAELVAACLDGPAPDEVLSRLHRDAEGIPFVVEELLGSLLDDGCLTRDGTGWRLTREPGTRIPGTLAAAVAQRVDRLGPAAGLVRAAAVLGRRFSLAAAAATAGISGALAVEHLRTATHAQLIGPDGRDDPDTQVFRHALTADAILAGLLPAERARLSRVAAAAVDDDVLAADLWVAAGEPVRAAERYCAAGRRTADRAALAAATALLDRGLALVTDRPRAAAGVTADLLEQLVRTLGLVGDMARVFALGTRLDAALAAAAAPVPRRVDAHLIRARMAASAAQWRLGLDQIAAARALVPPDADPPLTARIDAVAAHLYFAAAQPEDMREAQRLGRSALTAAEPETACEALEVLGRCAARTDPLAAEDLLRQAYVIADRHDLPMWRLRTAMEAAVLVKDRTNDTEPLLALREVALAAGAVITVAWLDFHLSNALLFRGDVAEAQRYVDQVAEAGRQLRRPELTVVATLSSAAVAACRADRETMERLLSASGDSVFLGAGAQLRDYLRGVCSMLAEDLDRAAADLDAAEEAAARAGGFTRGAHEGLRLLLRTVRGSASWPQYAELAESRVAGLDVQRSYLEWTRAVLAGRDGDPERAAEAAARAWSASARVPLNRYLGVRLAAPAALTDGWGAPLPWLREAEAFFHDAGLMRPAAACRALLRGVGAVSSQRRAGHHAIPLPLRRAGVTVREYDVLRLVAERLGNVEIAERLFLSPRTVERHVASLRHRTGLPDRAHLIAYARRTIG